MKLTEVFRKSESSTIKLNKNAVRLSLLTVINTSG